MKKFTSLTFLAVVLLFFIAVSSAEPEPEPLFGKRNNVCPQQYKRDVLGKRNNVKKCPCQLASATFDDSKVTGFVILAQDECGSTTVTGFFSRGLNDPQQNNYTFAIADDCGNKVKDLGTLGASFVNGGTKPFAEKFDNFNLNCDKSGILFLKSAKLSKRTYNSCQKTYYTKRAASNAFFAIYDNNDFYSGAGVNSF
ncbi:hypothetical protein RclHR1_03800019 [Rhizophagus clarus]|uniref:Uncharacterized protein n=1 Tax=Rhizophagus clarus TaxID=94130 RepID=A0A2Z6RGW2_9GLOM|nr:hypothetical protein RclHR1_03800019 [Rhizophagus clarus]GES76912.1 hypothetical protein GLOIN_2v1639397 [Rhizophagus clarus]